MKNLMLVLGTTLALTACSSKDKKTSANGKDTTNTQTTTPHISNNTNTNTAPADVTTIEWIDAPVKELGKLKKDQTIELTWRFRNTGDKNLVIMDVTAGCGCTIPEKPQQPFAPGQEGVIKASFNGSGSGTISKGVSVRANTTPEMHNLTFTGEIKE